MDDQPGLTASRSASGGHAIRKAVAELRVIDLTPFRESRGIEERRAQAALLREACIDIGFFYLSGHGIPEQEFADVVAMTHRFFELPLEEKMKVHTSLSPAKLGYVGRGRNNTGSDPNRPPDIIERFHLSRDILPGEPQEGRRSAGQSQWPEDAVLPGFADLMRRHLRNRCDVARQLAHVFALSLDLPEDYFDATYRYISANTVLNYYPPVDPATLRERQWSFSPHTDYNAFTLLYQDSLGGLQVLNSDGAWIEALPIPDTMIVNLGDLFARWTNDLYTSSLHRVINRSPEARVSIPVFTSPNGATTIACLETCAGPGNPPRYAPIRAEDYLKSMLDKAYETGLPTLGAKTAARLGNHATS
jgi:isopenicillin N synthase-like dioxygenase